MTHYETQLTWIQRSAWWQLNHDAYEAYVASLSCGPMSIVLHQVLWSPYNPGTCWSTLYVRISQSTDAKYLN